MKSKNIVILSKKNRLVNSLLGISIVFFIFSISCKKDTDNNFNQTVKDAEGNVYHTIKIGTQE
jgi:hypothetical protein